MRKKVIFNPEKGVATIKSLIYDEEIAECYGVGSVKKGLANPGTVCIRDRSSLLIVTVFDAEIIEILEENPKKRSNFLRKNRARKK